MSIHKPETRQELIDYCLRELGEPVLQINVANVQIEDRVEEALNFYREFHFEATEQVYLKAQVTASTLNLQSGNGNVFVVGDVITGSNSNATCTVQSLNADNVLMVINTNGTFLSNEDITGSKSLTVGQLANVNPIVKGSFDNRYFTIDEKVMTISRCLNFSSSGSGMNLFDVRYQLMINSMPSLTSIDLGYYSSLMTYLGLLNDILVGQKPIRYRRHTNRLYVDMDWSSDVSIGSYVVVEAYCIIDPEEFTNVYSDMWLKSFTTALIKRQWGINMKKFNGVQLPGGVVLNGQVIYEEAIAEIEQLKKECQETYMLPIDFYVG